MFGVSWRVLAVRRETSYLLDTVIENLEVEKVGLHLVLRLLCWQVVS